MIYAKYTEVLYNLLQNETTKAAIYEALSEFPMYEKTPAVDYISTREQLIAKLLDFYKFREIGFETVGRFIEELRISMNEIMPYYVQLYKSHDVMEMLDDPFGNVDITETFEQETRGVNDTSSSTETEDRSQTSMINQGKNVTSTTPQSVLSLSEVQINEVNYADNAGWTKDTSEGSSEGGGSSSSTGSATSEGTTKHTLTKKGNQGVNTYAHDMIELRTTFLNIDQMIINDNRISELFMRVY